MTNKPAYLPFDILMLFSLAWLALVEATAYLSRHIQRQKVWHSQIMLWMIYCVAYLLLFRWQGEGEPPPALCSLQASLIYTTPPACAVGCTCFIIDFYITLLPLHPNPNPIWRSRKLRILLIILPWVVLICDFVVHIMFFTLSKHEVQRVGNNLFCHSTDFGPIISTVVIVLLSAVVWFYFQVESGLIMYQNRKEFNQLNYKSSVGFLSLYVRSAIFTVGILISMGLCAYILPQDTNVNVAWALLLPIMPMFVATVFGCQRDMMKCWLFWQKRVSTVEDDQPPFTVQLSFIRNSTLPQENLSQNKANLIKSHDQRLIFIDGALSDCP